MRGFESADGSECDDPRQHMQVDNSWDSPDPAGSSAILAIEAALHDPSGETPATRVSREAVKDVTDAMESIPIGELHTVILPGSVKNRRVEHVRLFVTRRETGNFLLHGFEFCFNLDE
jgi:hypothetical protein